MEVPIDDPVNGQSKAISCRKCGLNSGDVDATGYIPTSRHYRIPSSDNPMESQKEDRGLVASTTRRSQLPIV
jgi:hypothetical protein